MSTEAAPFHGGTRGADSIKKYKLKDMNYVDMPMTDLHRPDKEQMRQYFHKTFERFETLFETLNCEEAFTVKPVHKLRHPMIFYLGHTACFYINKLVVAGVTTRINPKFEEMFAIGVDEMSWDDLNEDHYDWPRVAEVFEYRQQVRDRMEELFQDPRMVLEAPINFEQSTISIPRSFYWVANMGIEHEQIHFETMSVHVRELPMKYIRPHPAFAPCKESGEAPQNELVSVPGGKVTVGRPADDNHYGWDCDYGQETFDIQPLKVSKYIVTNKEFFEFMQDGGYTTQRYWDEEGWGWVSWKKPVRPYFWVDNNTLRTLTDEIPMPWDWPADVNNLEAHAFCKWKSEKTGKNIRLPTESEWVHIRDQTLPNDYTANLNLNAKYCSSCPVTKHKQGALYDMVGNVWQHTTTTIYPLPGYKTHPYYDDFSMPTFDGRHTCQKGGAWCSSGNEADKHARYAFRRHFFQFIGIRYVEGPDVNEKKRLANTVVGMDPVIDDAAAFAYHAGIEAIPNFAKRLADFAIDAFKTHHASKGEGESLRALDLYCGAGRTTFELTRLFSEVVGSDFTARQLQPAFSVMERGVVDYSLAMPWGTRVPLQALSKDYPWDATRSRAMFYQADPSNLHKHMSNFDMIVAWNVLEKHYRPRVVPAHLVSRLNAGGVLIMASSYDWDESITKKEEWLCGKGVDDHRDPREEIARLLNGLVAEVQDPVDMNAYFPTTERSGIVRNFQVSVWKKQ